MSGKVRSCSNSLLPTSRESVQRFRNLRVAVPVSYVYFRVALGHIPYSISLTAPCGRCCGRHAVYRYFLPPRAGPKGVGSSYTWHHSSFAWGRENSASSSNAQRATCSCPYPSTGSFRRPLCAMPIMGDMNKKRWMYDHEARQNAPCYPFIP